MQEFRKGHCVECLCQVDIHCVYSKTYVKGLPPSLCDLKKLRGDGSGRDETMLMSGDKVVFGAPIYQLTFDNTLKCLGSSRGE